MTRSKPLAGVGVVLGGHGHAWSDLLSLTRLAETLGADAVIVDGDVSFRPGAPDALILHSWSATLALLAHTERVAIGSMRIVHHWNAVALANAVATAEAMAPGRLRLSLSIGGQPADPRAGWPAPRRAGDRIAWLDEMIDALWALWSGDRVTREGHHLSLLDVRIRPLADPPPLEIGGRGPRLLDLVARRAARWDINLPPIPRLVDRAEEHLARACERIGRDPEEIERSMWIPLRVDREIDDALEREYRRLNPWFPMLRDDEVRDAIVAGTPSQCRERIEAIRDRLRIALPLLDLCGLPRDDCRRSLERLA